MMTQKFGSCLSFSKSRVEEFSHQKLRQSKSNKKSDYPRYQGDLSERLAFFWKRTERVVNITRGAEFHS